MTIARREGRCRAAQGSLFERSYAATRYLAGLSHRLLIFYGLWKLIWRLNANLLPAITRIHRRGSVGRIVNNSIHRHRISHACQREKERNESFLRYASNQKRINVKRDVMARFTLFTRRTLHSINEHAVGIAEIRSDTFFLQLHKVTRN